MAQRVSFEILTEALVACPDGPGSAECHGQICGLFCGSAKATVIDALLERWARDAEEHVNAGAHAVLRRMLSECQAALEDTDLAFAPLLPADAVALDVRVGSLAEWTQGFLYGLVEAGTDWADAPEAVREIITDFAEIARLRAGGLVDEDDEQSYAELVEYVRMGTLLMHAEGAQARKVAAEREP